MIFMLKHLNLEWETGRWRKQRDRYEKSEQSREQDGRGKLSVTFRIETVASRKASWHWYICLRVHLECLAFESIWGGGIKHCKTEEIEKTGQFFGI